MNLEIWFYFVLATFESVIATESDDEIISVYTNHSWKLADATNVLAYKVYNKLAMKEGKNQVFCPLAIANMVGILYNAARNKTAQELSFVLGYDNVNLNRETAWVAHWHLLTSHLISSKPKKYNFTLRDTILINNKLDIKPLFKVIVKEFFSTSLKIVNFTKDGTKIVEEVNDYGRHLSKNKIQNLLQTIDPTSDVILVSSAYFRGQWKYPFEPGATKNRIFYNQGFRGRYVKMMEQENTFKFSTNNQISVLEMPLRGGNMSFVIFLPTEMDGLRKLYITSDLMLEYLLSMFPKRVKVTIPKFKISCFSNVTWILRTLRVRRIFRPKITNMTGMTTSSNVKIGDLKHKAVIHITESGVEIDKSKNAKPVNALFSNEPVYKFLADHPFLFVIIDKRNGLNVLMGHLMNV